MSAENLFTTSRIENVNQIIAELYDDSILLEKRMESFFLNLNNIVFFEKANFLFYQKQGQNYKTHSIYTINWNDEQKRRYQEEYCHMDDVLSILDSDSNVTFLTNQLFNQEVRCSFPQYLAEKRLLYAYKLLSGSDSIPIQEVCQRCGYSSRTYFTSSFKKRFGIPPSKVRYFHSKSDFEGR